MMNWVAVSFLKRMTRGHGPFWLFDGVIYHKDGWLGCQLKSIELRPRPAQHKRNINGHDMRVFACRKRPIGYEICWSIHNATCASVDKFYRDLMVPIDHNSEFNKYTQKERSA